MGLMEVGIFEDLKEEHRKDSGLTREDIESLTVDENLTDLERAQLFLSTNAHQLQQSCAFERLPNIFRDYGAAAYDALFPTLASSIEHFNPHIQVLAGKAFATVMQVPNAPKDMATWLLPMTLRVISSIQLYEVLQAWIELLCLLVPKLSLKVVKEDLLQLALTRGKVEEAVTSRVICSRLLGAIAPMLEPQEIEQLFLSKAMALCQDTDAEVRISMCNQINAISHAVGVETTKVLKILGKERTATYLKEAFLFLLTDNSREVQEKLIATLQHIIGQFAVSNEEQRISIYTSILPHLLQAEKDIASFNLWRLQASIFETFSQLIDYVSSDLIFEYLVPLCFYHMTESVLPVRSAAAITLAIFIRNNRRAMQRYELCQRVVRDFGHGRSYTARLVFIDFCETFLSISSSHMFKEHFLDAAITILQDEVIGVRMRACALLPLLKGVVKLPDDAASLERINFLATQRLNDNDKQVAAAAKAVSDTFKHISVRCLGVEPGNENYALQMEVEATDKQREEDEWNMLSKEEQEEQRKLDEMIQKMKLDGNKKFLLTSGVSPGGGAAEKASLVTPSKTPAIARFKSTVASLNFGSPSQLGVPSVAMKQGLSAVGTTATGMMLSRSPPILRAQGAPLSAGLAKAISLQQGIVTPLAPSSLIRTIPTSISMPAPAQVKSPSASSTTEPTNDATPVSSGSNVAPSKGTLRPNLRTARKSS